jgi:hypothetical protein
MGRWPDDAHYQRRYRYAQEYVEILKVLWTQRDVDYGGEFFHLRDCRILAHPHISGGGFDLPIVGPIFEEYVSSFRLGSQLRFYPGDFFTDPMPQAEVLAMGRVLHDWDLEEKKRLLAKVYAALPTGGALIDDARRQHAIGLLMSLNMLIETKGVDFTGADCRAWMREVGCRDTYMKPLDGHDSMVVRIK